MALWTPANATTALWLDGADASTLYDATSGGSLVAADGAVARWEDKSGNARHVTQGTLGSRPARKTSIQNGRDVLRFDGSADWLETTFASFGTSYSLVLVALSTNVTPNSVIFGCRSNSSSAPINPNIGYVTGLSATIIRDDLSNSSSSSISGLTNNQFNLYGVDRSGNSALAYRDGTAASSQVTGTIGTTTTNRTTIGGAYPGTNTVANFHNGDVAEVVFGLLADRQRIEGYLAHKWGLAGSLPNDHPYKNNAPKYGVGGIAAAIAEII
jgi:hypothetical protein